MDAAATPYTLMLEERKSAALTGVTDVERFDDTEVVLHTGGGRLTLTGSGMRVSNLQVKEGRLLVEGNISGVQYDEGKGKRRRGMIRRALG